jgi:hypothetical protein
MIQEGSRHHVTATPLDLTRGLPRNPTPAVTAGLPRHPTAVAISRREAGDELARRAVAKFRRGEFLTVGAAVRAVMADDSELTKIYSEGGS